MIAKINGILEEVVGGSALVRTEGGLTYEVLLSSHAAARLGASLGKPVSLHTLDFIESQGQGTTMTPRLAGFLNTDDRRFFELFTTCKGIGNRRGLRALTLATGQIAAAIVDRDVAMLQSLPEIGKRTAETIIATLHGKVDNFAAVAAARTTEGETGSESGRSGGKAAEALEVLLQLGENRIQAMTWIDQALRDDEQPQDTRDLINRVYRIKAGA